MKLIVAVFCGVIMLPGAQKRSAQTQTEKIEVSGNCGMCKKTIEKAARSAGAREASWDVTTKILSVTYNAKATNNTTIQQAVADAGYDTKDKKGNDAAYEKLHACCRYKRTRGYPATL